MLPQRKKHGLWVGVCTAVFLFRLVAGFTCSTGSTANECIVGVKPPYIFLRNVTTADACCASCNSDSKCAGWTLKTSAQHCALHDTVTSTRISPTKCKASGLIPGKPTPAPAPGPSPAPGGGLSFSHMFIGSKLGGSAVLQMDTETQVWGAAPPGVNTVSVLLGGKLAATSPVNHSAAAPDRAWSVRLPPQSAKYDVKMTVSSGSMNSSVKVHFGQVVMCSGQSNMGMDVGYGAPHTIPPHGFGPNKTSFSADNGTAENDNAFRYTGKIFLFHSAQSIGDNPGKYTWSDVSNETLGGYSAACWYSGKSFYETSLRASNTPLGLITGAVGGSPIEYWIPQTDPTSTNTNPCEIDIPQCDNSGGKNDSIFFQTIIAPLAPYTIGHLVWDQAERDVKCPKAMAAYPCMQKFLISSWKEVFNSTFAFVGIQLAGYTAAIKNGTGSYDGYITAEMVFTMRLQQEAGCKGVDRCAVVPTYDVSCQAGADSGCPYGSVHQPHKREIGDRVGRQLARLLPPPTSSASSLAPSSQRTTTAAITEGPRAVTATLVHDLALATKTGAKRGHGSSSGTSYAVEVAFTGSTSPFHLAGTRNCTTVAGFCCDGSANNRHTVDFDATHDGVVWVNGTAATLDVSTGKVRFEVALPGAPTHVRYTGASIWPQCAVYGADGLPAFPFELPVTVSTK